MYYDKEQSAPQEDGRYLSQNDTSILRQKDLRKTRLTLKMLNDIRIAGVAHKIVHQEELGLIRKMYASPPPEAAP